MEKQYSSGELASLCEVSVRTVQFYDKQGLLKPVAYSEGNRRLYGESELFALKLICSYKALGLSLGEIRKLLTSENKTSLLSDFLHAQALKTKEELSKNERKLQKINLLCSRIQNNELSDDAVLTVSELLNKKSLKKTHAVMLAWGIAADLVQIAGIALAAWFKSWAWLAAGYVPAVIICAALTLYYLKSVKYLCPLCGHVFGISFGQTFGRHTPTTRLLTCPHCGVKSNCTEVSTDYKK